MLLTGSIFLVLYIGFIVIVVLSILAMLFKFVTAHERIAAALERAAQNLGHDKR